MFASRSIVVLASLASQVTAGCSGVWTPQTHGPPRDLLLKGIKQYCEIQGEEIPPRSSRIFSDRNMGGDTGIQIYWCNYDEMYNVSCSVADYLAAEKAIDKECGEDYGGWVREPPTEADPEVYSIGRDPGGRAECGF